MANRINHTIAESWDEIERALEFGLPLTTKCGETIERLKIGRAGGGGKSTDCRVCDGVSRQAFTERRKVRSAVDRDAPHPHYVYRCYDATSRLIYVGCTNNPVNRLASHRRKAWWGDQIASTRLIVFPTRSKALEKEREAIATEKPRWNVKGKWPYRDHSWTADDCVDMRTAVTQAVDTTHGVYGTHTRQLITDIDRVLRDDFGVTTLSRRLA